MDLPLRIGVFLLAAVVSGGLVYGAYQVLPETTVENQGVAVEAFEDAFNVTAGNTFAVPVNLTNFQSADRNVTLVVRDLDGAGLLSESSTLELVGGGGAATWVPVSVEAAAVPGTYRLAITADVGFGADDVYADTVTVRVVEPGTAVAEGDAVAVRWAAAFADGRTYHGTHDYAGDPNFKLAAPFSPSEEVSVLTAGWASNDAPIPGLGGAVLGVQAGETRMVEVPAWRVFGNDTIEQQFFRHSVRQLAFDVETPETTLNRSDFDSLARGAGHTVANLKIGDEILWPVWTNHGIAGVPVVIEDVNLENATISFPDTSERFQLQLLTQQGWRQEDIPHEARFTQQDDDGWVLRWEPTVAPEELFTWFAGWPNGTFISECSPDPNCGGGDYASQDNITITNLDGSWVGTNFTYRGLTHTVKAVNADSLDVFYQNPEELAGVDFRFYVTVVDRAAASG